MQAICVLWSYKFTKQGIVYFIVLLYCGVS